MVTRGRVGSLFQPPSAALAQLAAAQTPILFLIIGLKFKLTGAAPALCASLLFARHGGFYRRVIFILIPTLIVTLTF